jgi:hypothetical protein
MWISILLIIIIVSLIFGRRVYGRRKLWKLNPERSSLKHKAEENQEEKLPKDKKAKDIQVEEIDLTPQPEPGLNGMQEEPSRSEDKDGLKVKQQPISKQVNVENIPGRRKPRDPIDEPGENQQNKSFRSKPEIICWKRERQWIPAVELPEELIGNPHLTVYQEATSLTEDQSREGCWPLSHGTGEIVVRWNEEDIIRESKITLGEENYLLFKLSGQDQNQGRHVKSPSIGSYLVIAPDNWNRDQSLSGAPPVTSEPVSFVGYQAHYFDLNKGDNGKIAFRTIENEIVSIETKTSCFKLAGNLLNDASKNIGPLFGTKPPQIYASSNEVWSNVKTIVVGEEGGGRGRWRTAFTPILGQTEQDLPFGLVAPKVGWFFLRFYDANDDLIESLDFRFAQGLKAINVHQPIFLPLETGHVLVSVEFIHEPDCKVQPADTFAGRVRVEQKDDRTILAIPPDPAYDESRWLVGPQNEQQLELRILAERIWWAGGPEDNVPCEWIDTCLALARDDFIATSNKAIWVRFPRPRWINEVYVGFEQATSRCFSLKVTENTLAVPLREFADTHEVADRTKDHYLKIWIKRDDVSREGTMAFTPADPLIKHKKEPLITAPQKDDGENKAVLNLAVIPTPRLATVLTKLRRMTHGPMRVLVKEVRRDCFKGRAMCEAKSVEFVKEALCMVAIYLELCDEDPPPTPGLKKCWIERASVARNEYPEIVDSLKNRYKTLNSRSNYCNSSTHQQGKTNESD